MVIFSKLTKNLQKNSSWKIACGDRSSEFEVVNKNFFLNNFVTTDVEKETKLGLSRALLERRAVWKQSIFKDLMHP